MSQTLFDVVILALILVSALLAYIRGFMREFLSVLSWVGAAFFTYFTYPYAFVLVHPLITYEGLATLVSIVVLFLVSLVVFTLMGNALSLRIQKTSFNPLDRALGFVFGVLRGLFLLSLLYLLTNTFWHIRDLPTFVTQSRFFPLVSAASESLLVVVPKNIFGKGRSFSHRATLSARQEYHTLLVPPPRGDKASKKARGYSSKERSQLDRLVDTVQ